MLNWPPKQFHKDLESQKSAPEHTHCSSHQNGFSIPKENLTHISAYLDPPSLFFLSCVNKMFYEHIKDDHTWHRAFLLNFLGISPESNLGDENTFLLRRFESTWRKEYVLRYNLIRRWARSRNSPISHAPVYSTISSMHPLPGNSLLCSSVQYGVVSRSIIFTGRVLRGFLSPSPFGTGLGMGNPNTEFSPNVSTCALGSEGGTAKIAWGFRSGEVMVMTAARTMETSSRSAAKLVRCDVEEQHDGEVIHVAWDDTGSYIASAGKDGRVKVWEAKKLKCVWSSEYLVPDVCTRVGFSINKGCVVAAMRSGDIFLWTGLDWALSSGPVSLSKGIKVPCPADAQSEDHILPVITIIHLDPACNSVLVAYQSIPRFYHIFFRDLNEIIVTRYYDSTFIGAGAITSLLPCHGSKSDHSSFILAGDQMGCINVYPYASDPVDVVSPIRKFEAHEDGAAVTALAWNGLTLVSGSANGATNVFDALTLNKLRVFDTPVPRPRGGRIPTVGDALEDSVESVKQIILGPERDVLIVCVGSRVMGFKADPVPRSGTKVKKGTQGKKKARGTTMTKGYDQHVLKKLVSESISEIKQDSERRRRVYGREREQIMNLEQLGLDEVEAVEYVLMLSRDEALEREREQILSSMTKGVFEGDFDDIGDTEQEEYTVSSTTSDISSPNDTDSLPSVSSISASAASSLSSSPHRLSGSSTSISMSLFSAGTPKTPNRGIGSTSLGGNPRGSPSSPPQKIQISPRCRYMRTEPLEAGFEEEFEIGFSKIASSLSSSNGGLSDVANDAAIAAAIAEENRTTEHFPSIHGKDDIQNASRDKGKAPPKSAWNIPLGGAKRSVGNTPLPPNKAWPPAGKYEAKVTSAPESSWARATKHVEEEDEDLKLAILLSLEDAQKRGDIL